MKKIKFVLAFVMGIVATSIFGACSCKKDSNVSVTSLTVSATTIDVVVGTDFTLTYSITPQAATNKKVYVEFPDGETYVTSKDGYVFDGENSKTITFTAKNRKEGEKDTEARVKFSTDSGNFSATVKVVIHDTPTVLATPQNLVFEDGKLKWDPVLNAGGYNILIGEEVYTSTTNEYTPNLPYATEHTIKVQATTNSIDFADGEESKEIKIYPLATPKITSVNNGEITWEPVTNATHYQIEYASGKTQLVESDVLSYSFANVLDTNNFVVKVRALNYRDSVIGDVPTLVNGVPSYITSSFYSSSRTINRLVAPKNIKVVNNTSGKTTNGNLTWDSVSGATNYVVYINNGTQEFTLNSKQNVLDLSSVSGFDYAMGKYSVVIRAEGNLENTISGEFSSSEKFDFTKLGYLTGSIDNVLDKLTISTSSLISLGVINTDISKLYYELIFVNEESTITNDKNYIMTTSSRELILSEISGLKSGVYQKVIIRPYLSDNSITNVANASKILVTDTIDVFAEGFTKLPSSKISSISKESVLNLQLDTSNVEKFVLQLAGAHEDTQEIAKTANFITIVEDQVSIDLTKADLKFGTTEMVAGTYTLRVLPISNNCINATLSDCNIFTFTKARSVDAISVEDGVVSWNNVPSNFGYSITFNETTSTLDINNFRPTNIKDSNAFSIVVLGNDENVINSDTYTPAPILRSSPITSYSLNQGTLLWAGEEGATYIIKYYADTEYQKEVKTNVNYFDAFRLDAATRIAVVKQVENQFDSIESKFVNLAQLSSVQNINVVQNAYRLAFDKIENENGYRLDIVDAKGVKHTSIYTSSDLTTYSEIQWVVDLNTDYFTNGINSVKIVALGQSVDSTANSTYYISSVPSANLDIEVLPQVEAEVKNGEMHWTLSSIISPDGYRFVISKDQILGATSDLIVDRPSVLKEGSYDWAQLASGDYNITLQAFAKENTNVINGQVSTFSFCKIDGTTLSVKNGEIVFDGVEGATGYKVYMYDMDDTLVSDIINTTVNSGDGKVVVNFDNFEADTEYKFAIKVLGGQKINSNESTKRSVVKLNSVQNFTKNANTISWTNVTNNAGYVLSGKNGFAYNNSTNTDVVSVAFANTSIENSGKYDIEIIALGSSTTGTEDIGYLNSEPVRLTIVKLSEPSTLHLSDGVLTWKTYESITGHEVPLHAKIVVSMQDDGEDFEYTCEQGNSINLYEKNELIEGAYSISVQFIGDENLILSSKIVEYNDGAFVSRIASTNMAVNNGKIVFNKVENASEYRVYVLEAGDTYVPLDENAYVIKTGDVCEVVLNPTALMVGQNTTLKLMTIATDNTSYINSNLSAPLVVNKLNAISDLNIGEYDGVSGRLIWTPVANATSYVIVVDNGENVQEFDVSGQSTNYYDVADLQLSAGTYNVTIYAKGSTTSGTGVSYLDSQLSNPTTITFVSDSIAIKSDKGILSWNRVEGVQKYKLSISDGSTTQYRTISSADSVVSYNLDKDSFINDQSKDYTVSVVPLSLSNAYYLVSESEAISLVVNRALTIKELMVNEGIITWKMDITSLTLEQIVKAKELFDKYKANPDAFEESDEDSYLYEELYPYWNFTITINNVDYNIIPDRYTAEIDFTIKYYYEITDNVSETTKYDVVVRAQGNKTCVDADGNVILDGATPVASTYLPSMPSEKLTAYKSTVPAGIVSENGTIKFNLVTTLEDNGGVLNSNYVKEYYLFGVPADGSKVLQWSINVPDDYTDFSYVIDLKELGLDDNQTEIVKNVVYSYKICTRGTFSGDMSSGYTLNLRSNFYSPVTITFLSNIEIQYSDYDTELGGIVKWGQNAISGDVTHILYIMKESEAELIGNAWWKNENVIRIDLESDASYFSFDDDKAKEAGIEGNMRYRVAVKYAGNNTTYIANGDNPKHVKITTLNTIEFDELDSEKIFIRDGNFYWREVENCSQYKVMIFKTLLSNNIQLVGPYYTTNNFFSCDEFDDGQEVLGYSIQITPLGDARLVAEKIVNFVNGYSNQPTTSYGDVRYFPQLPKATGLTVIYQDYNNLVTWDENYSAKSYTVLINGVKTNEAVYSENSFVFPSNWGPGEYQIRVKYNSGSTGYLNGLYCQPIIVKKMYEPQLHVENGIVTWSTSKSETLTSSGTNIALYRSDETGAILSNTPIDSQKITDPLITTYELNGDVGYYVVAVQFVSNQVSEGLYQLSSGESRILVKKLPPVSAILNGTYNGNDCGYDNYVKWQIDPEAYAYKVELVNPTNEEIVGTPYYYYVDPSTGLNDSESFVLSNDDDTYVCFNLQAMFNYNISTVEVVVTAVGNTTEVQESNDDILNTLGYATSEAVSHTVSIPKATPNILSYDKGVIRWKGGATYGANINDKNIVDSESLSHNVEIVFVSAKTHVFDINDYTFSEVAVPENTTYYWEYSEGKEEVFYCPYIAPGVQVKLRYYTSNSTSDYTPVFTISNNNLFYAGSGTESDPYIVYHKNNNNTELAKMFSNIQYRPNSHVMLMSDIDMKDTTWTQIENFDGHIYGNSHNVANITVSNKLSKGVNYASLIKNIGENGKIEGINFVNVSMSAYVNNETQTLEMAVVAQNNNGIIQNVDISGSVYGFAYKTLTFAGVAQNNYGTISDCDVNIHTQKQLNIGGGVVAFKGVYLYSNNKDAKIGGIALNNYGTLKNCNVGSTLEAISTGSNCAGFVGGIAYSNNYVDANSMIQNCKITSDAKITANNIGGIAYENNENAIIKFGANEAQIYVVGYIKEGGVAIQSVFSYFGGLVARNKGNISSSYMYVDTINTDYNSKNNVYFGGMVGYNETNNDNVNTGKVKNNYVVINTIQHNSENPEKNIASIVGFVISCANDDFKNLYANTPLTAVSGGNGGNGDVDANDVNTEVYTESSNANLKRLYLLSGIEVGDGITAENTELYNALQLKYEINEDYGMSGNTLPPYYVMGF